MAMNIDFNALKARTMGSGADEEAVTVDTRGLISKVLARYSGKWWVGLVVKCGGQMLTITTQDCLARDDSKCC